MAHDEHETARARLRLAFELYDAGAQIMRQNLRRRFPQAPEDEIEARLRRWLLERPGAEQGDAPGKPLAWPRKAS